MEAKGSEVLRADVKHVRAHEHFQSARYEIGHAVRLPSKLEGNISVGVVKRLQSATFLADAVSEVA